MDLAEGGPLVKVSNEDMVERGYLTVSQGEELFRGGAMKESSGYGGVKGAGEGVSEAAGEGFMGVQGGGVNGKCGAI